MTAKEMIVLVELLHDECKSRSSCELCPLLLTGEDMHVCAVANEFPEEWPVRMLSKERTIE